MVNRTLLQFDRRTTSGRAAPGRVTLMLALAVLLMAPGTPAAAQDYLQPPDEASIFRLVTFQTTGNMRLGATQGNGEHDIVDIHNAIMAMKGHPGRRGQQSAVHPGGHEEPDRGG